LNPPKGGFFILSRTVKLISVSEKLLVYLLQAAGCISIAWLFYKVLLEKKTRVKTIRLYFLIAMVVSMLAPLSPFAIRTSLFAVTANAETDNMAGQANG
jgi:hypothetical protein